MKIEISNGELLDKITILQIKASNISDKEKKINVVHELETLQPSVDLILESYDVKDLFEELYDVNLSLWYTEDSIREKEKLKTFDQLFIQLARNVYITNDRRAAIKKQINLITKSNLIEEKSYEQY